jgi:hypothetical protein
LRAAEALAWREPVARREELRVENLADAIAQLKDAALDAFIMVPTAGVAAASLRRVIAALKPGAALVALSDARTHACLVDELRAAGFAIELEIGWPSNPPLIVARKPDDTAALSVEGPPLFDLAAFDAVNPPPLGDDMREGEE